MEFRFAIPKPPPGPLVEVSVAEAEQRLLKRLEQQKDKPADALWELARFYQQTRQIEKGLACLRQAIQLISDPEAKAGVVLGLGQMMETAGDYPAAVRFYKEALALEPTRTATWYFINNNLGFCLNTLGEYAEGEGYCRKAREIDLRRPNAHKNLGLALAGQGRYPEAAECFVAATQANAADARALRLLQDLLQQHPELHDDFQEVAEACRKAVELAAGKAAAVKPVVLRGWRKGLVLARMRFGSFLDRMLKRAGPR